MSSGIRTLSIVSRVELQMMSYSIVLSECCLHMTSTDYFTSQTFTPVSWSMHLFLADQPMRVIREVVLLTSDRNLRLKALTLNIPARPLRPFVEWSCLRPVSIPTNRSTITTSEHLHTSPKLHTNTKSSAGGSGRWLNRK